jgi:hypothetical protein
METRECCNETVLGKYTKNDLLIIFGLNPDINEIIIKDAITYIHGQYIIFPPFSWPRDRTP